MNKTPCGKPCEACVSADGTPAIWTIDENFNVVRVCQQPAEAISFRPPDSAPMSRAEEIRNRRFRKKKDAADEARRLAARRRDELLHELDSIEKLVGAELPTTAEKLETYERIFHRIQLFAQVSMDNKKLGQTIENICAWSVAHRGGNGELTQEEQDLCVAHEFKRLLDV
jgi:hypothetical protein